MLKQIIGDVSARLLRAAAGRIATDLELARTIRATSSSAALIDLLMPYAKACSSRIEVMHTAFDAAPQLGFICELGVFRGQSLNEIARRYPSEQIHGFDTFTGLPEFWRDGFPEGAFDVSAEKLVFEKNCVLHKGLFDETLPAFLEQVGGQARPCGLRPVFEQYLSVADPRLTYPVGNGHRVRRIFQLPRLAGTRTQGTPRVSRPNRPWMQIHRLQ